MAENGGIGEISWRKAATWRQRKSENEMKSESESIAQW